MATDQEYRLTITVSDETEPDKPSRSYSIIVAAKGRSLSAVLEAAMKQARTGMER